MLPVAISLMIRKTSSEPERRFRPSQSLDMTDA